MWLASILWASKQRSSVTSVDVLLDPGFKTIRSRGLSTVRSYVVQIQPIIETLRWTGWIVVHTKRPLWVDAVEKLFSTAPDATLIRAQRYDSNDNALDRHI